MSGHSAGQGVALGAAGAAAGAVHVLGAEAPGLRRGLPLVGAVHRLSDPPPPPLSSTACPSPTSSYFACEFILTIFSLRNRSLFSV